MNLPISKAQQGIINLLKKHKNSEIVFLGYSACPRIYYNNKYIKTVHTRTFNSMLESGLLIKTSDTERVYGLPN